MRRYISKKIQQTPVTESYYRQLLQTSATDNYYIDNEAKAYPSR